MTKILFTPLGMTDPISNNHDGAMLHICRHLGINKVYFYMSREIWERDQTEGHCYSESVKMLSAHLGRKIEIAEPIVRKELSEVQLFDYFIEDFRRELTRIHAEEPEAELYLNVSSGTPAMKSALHILAALPESGRMIPVQVATPVKASNPRPPRSTDLLEIWESNKDNSGSENRTSESGHINFLNEIKKQMLSSLIRGFDYVGALLLARDMNDYLSEAFMRMLDGAAKRITFSASDACQVFEEYEIMPKGSDPSSKLYQMEEYLQVLKIKARKKEYGDFLRGITPLIVDIFEVILREKLKFNVNNYVDVKKAVRLWNIEKLMENEPVWLALNRKYEGSGGMKRMPVYSDHLLVIINCLSYKTELNNVCNSLRNVEEKIRNIAAHEIVHVSDEFIKERTGMLPSDIIGKLKKALGKVDKAVADKDFFKSYDIMNEVLLKELNKTSE